MAYLNNARPLRGGNIAGTVNVSGDVNFDANAIINGTVNVSGDVNYSGSSYGFIHNTGLWEDLRFPAQGINPAGSTAPPSVNTTHGLLEFAAGNDEIVCGVAQMPHGWKAESNVSPHVHCMASVDTDPQGAATETAADGVAVASTNYFTSATGGFTGHANEYLAITVTGTNTQAQVGYYQISSVISDTNVLLTSNPTNGGDDDSVTWAIYPDTVALKFEHAAKDVNETWDQATYTAETKYFRFDALAAGAAKHQLFGFSAIDMTGLQDSACILWRLTRDADNSNDTYADNLLLMEIDFHYKVNTLGSIAETGDDF